MDLGLGGLRELMMDREAWHAVHGILQARILEWIAIPSPGDLSNSGIKLGFSCSVVSDSL